MGFSTCEPSGGRNSPQLRLEQNALPPDVSTRPSFDPFIEGCPKDHSSFDMADILERNEHASVALDWRRDWRVRLSAQVEGRKSGSKWKASAPGSAAFETVRIHQNPVMPQHQDG